MISTIAISMLATLTLVNAQTTGGTSKQCATKKVLTLSECNAFAKSKGKRVSGSGNYRTWPKGCFLYSRSSNWNDKRQVRYQTYYYNKGGRGSKGNSRAKPICRTSGSATTSADTSTAYTGKTSIQAHLYGLHKSLTADEKAVKALASKECTPNPNSNVRISGAVKETSKSCGTLGVLSGCLANSHSYMMSAKYSAAENKKCNCQRTQRGIQRQRSGDISSHKREIARLLGIKNKEVREANAIIAKFESNGALTNMDKAVVALKSLLKHVNTQKVGSALQIGSASTSALETLSKVHMGEHLAALLQVAVDRTRKYSATNIKKSETEVTSTPAANLIRIINEIIDYIRKQRIDIQGQVDSEKKDAKTATATYNSEKARLDGLIRVALRDVSNARKTEGECTTARTGAASAHGTVVANAKQSHKSFQKYLKDVEKERGALAKIVKILQQHGQVIGNAHKTANANGGKKAHLYSTSK